MSPRAAREHIKKNKVIKANRGDQQQEGGEIARRGGGATPMEQRTQWGDDRQRVEYTRQGYGETLRRASGAPTLYAIIIHYAISPLPLIPPPCLPNSLPNSHPTRVIAIGTFPRTHRRVVSRGVSRARALFIRARSSRLNCKFRARRPVARETKGESGSTGSTFS